MSSIKFCLLAFGFLMISADAIAGTPRLLNYLELISRTGATALMKDFEVELVSVARYDCASPRLMSQIDCMIQTVHGFCRKQKAMPLMDCLAWGDIVSAIQNDQRSVFKYTNRNLSKNEYPSTLRQLQVHHSLELERIYSLTAKPCNDRKDLTCEAIRLESFCYLYSTSKSIPASLCAAMILRAKFEAK